MDLQRLTRKFQAAVFFVSAISMAGVVVVTAVSPSPVVACVSTTVASIIASSSLSVLPRISARFASVAPTFSFVRMFLAYAIELPFAQSTQIFVPAWFVSSGLRLRVLPTSRYLSASKPRYVRASLGVTFLTVQLELAFVRPVSVA